MLQLVQLYRAAAILLVLLFHAGLVVRGRYGTTPLADLWEIGFSGVHLFFVLSGFIILSAHREDINRPAQLPRYLARRLARIYPLYWMVFFVFGGWRLFSGQLPGLDFFTNALIFHSKVKQVVQVSWTLAHEMVFYLIFALLIVSRRLGILVMSLWLLATFIQGPRPAAVMLNPINIEFGFGLFAAWLCGRLQPLSDRHRNRLGSAALALGILGFLATSVWVRKEPDALLYWYRHPIPVYGYGLSSALLLLASISPRLEALAGRNEGLVAIGNASYAIYLVHLPFEKMASDLFKKVPLIWQPEAATEVRAAVLWLGVSTLALGAGLLVHRLIEKPLVFSWLRRSIDRQFPRNRQQSSSQ